MYGDARVMKQSGGESILILTKNRQLGRVIQRTEEIDLVLKAIARVEFSTEGDMNA